MSQSPVILVDVMNAAFRLGFAHQHLKSEDGVPTGVLYGVLKTLHDLRENVSKRIVMVWDNGIPVPGAARPVGWRDSIVKNYKAKRTTDIQWPEYAAVISQMPALAKAINLLGYDNVASMGLEADDVIGILSQEIRGEILIFSTDKDFYQLLDEARVHILVPKKTGGKFKRIYQSDVEREYGIPVSRWAEYLALGGDKSDNIKPMRGMGPKTAIKLVQSGVNLTGSLGLSGQPPEFQLKYGLVWQDIRNSYRAALLPLSRLDKRFNDQGIFPDFQISDGRQHWLPGGTSAASFHHIMACFDRLCANHDLTTIMALRRQLFNTEEK